MNKAGRHCPPSASDIGFVHDKNVLFLVRDTRGILISAYYSFGYSLKFSEVEKIDRVQVQQRAAIQAMNLDQCL